MGFAFHYTMLDFVAHAQNENSPFFLCKHVQIINSHIVLNHHGRISYHQNSDQDFLKKDI
jgi:predicted TIM-barrel fold metal-dependent hydrolase